MDNVTITFTLGIHLFLLNYSIVPPNFTELEEEPSIRPGLRFVPGRFVLAPHAVVEACERFYINYKIFKYFDFSLQN